MSPVFTINFRREVFVRERARSRARVVALGGWLLYFGLLGMVVGLYGLNCASLTRRALQVERQTSRLAAAQGTAQDWTVDQTQLAALERFYVSPRRWRDKLVRLSSCLPINVALSSVAVNPDNLSNPADQNKLVITGQLRPVPGQDPMRGVVQFASVLQRDSVFSAGYQSIRLSQSHVTAGAPALTEFVIECR